jgi:hypothetical protein
VTAVLAAASSNAALVEVNSIVLRANARFVPNELPRKRRVPIQVSGFFDVSSEAGVPPRLQRIVIELDRDGRLAPQRFRTCRAPRIENATTRTARRRCAGALVGTGTVEAMVQVEGRWLRVLSPLSLFKGPTTGNRGTMLAHAQPTSLPGETYVVPITVSRGRGGYVATVDVPEIFNPSGVLVRSEVRLGRRPARGERPPRSIATARCSDGIIETHGTFTFGDGTVIAGPAATACTPKR